MGRSPEGAMWGFFRLGSLRIISSGTPKFVDPIQWEHVSVSLPDRVPTWEEMDRVKSLFWDDEETVVQFHPARSAYVNAMPFCLHLWKRIGVEFALPPRETLA
jgi:hypothetical protein